MTTPEQGHIQFNFESQFKALQDHISNYRAALNQEGVWLFLCTLGCWSVAAGLLKFAALGLAAVLFGDRLRQRVVETRSFKTLINDLKTSISESLPDGDSQKARMYDVIVLQQTELSALNNLKNTWIFMLCWSFWGISFILSVSDAV